MVRLGGRSNPRYPGVYVRRFAADGSTTESWSAVHAAFILWVGIVVGWGWDTVTQQGSTTSGVIAAETAVDSDPMAAIHLLTSRMEENYLAAKEHEAKRDVSN